MKQSFSLFRTLAAFAVFALLTVVSSGNATAQVTFSGTNNAGSLSASATFSLLGGGDLQVTLVNTFSLDTPDQSHVLTGVFFAGANGLGEVSATAGAGSVEWAGHTSSAPESSAVLGTEWAYGSGASFINDPGATAGIFSSGYYTPGMGNFASPGDMLDGSAYGIVSAGYAGSDGDGLSTRQYIGNTMVFVLSGFGGNLSDISHVSFQYGTSSGEPSLAGNLVPTPEPKTALILVAFLGVLGGRRLLLRRA